MPTFSLVFALLAAAPSFEVALLCTQPRGQSTELFFQRPGQPLGEPAAVFRHRPGAEVKGTLLPGTRTVLAVADYARVRDLTFGAALFALEPGREPRLLTESVYHASRPLITPKGRVYVQRGKAGPEPTPEQAAEGRLREDELFIDEIELSTGQARTVHAFRGYIVFLAGAHAERLVLYRVSFQQAQLLELEPDTGQERVLQASMPAFARDFVVDDATGALLYTQLDPQTRRWVVERQDLETLERTRLASGRSAALAPSFWPGGKLAYNPGGSAGLLVLDGQRALAPLGAGVDYLRGFSHGDRYAIGLHTRPSRLPEPFVLEVATKKATRLPFPRGARVDVAGLYEGAAP